MPNPRPRSFESRRRGQDRLFRTLSSHDLKTDRQTAAREACRDIGRGMPDHVDRQRERAVPVLFGVGRFAGDFTGKRSVGKCGKTGRRRKQEVELLEQIRHTGPQYVDLTQDPRIIGAGDPGSHVRAKSGRIRSSDRRDAPDTDRVRRSSPHRSSARRCRREGPSQSRIPPRDSPILRTREQQRK